MSTCILFNNRNVLVHNAQGYGKHVYYLKIMKLCDCVLFIESVKGAGI